MSELLVQEVGGDEAALVADRASGEIDRKERGFAVVEYGMGIILVVAIVVAIVAINSGWMPQLFEDIIKHLFEQVTKNLVIKA